MTLRLLLLLLLPVALVACGPQPASDDAETIDDSNEGDSLVSEVAIYDLDTQSVRTVVSARAHYEAPNWTPDGEALIFNSDGRLYRVPVGGGELEQIPTGDLDNVINDHGISPDGSQIAFTNIVSEDGELVDGHIYVMPIEGGEPQRVTDNMPSYWHGWSPDGTELAYCAERDGNYDIYTIKLDGSPERRITTSPEFDDGPDYSPDGEYIYFNSDRAGTMDIWRVPAEGGEPEQVTDDEYDDWFPHPSPDGRHLVYLTYEPGTEGHPANRDVRLRMITDGGEPQELVQLFGGQGTINVPSWSPDSRAFAFVRYRFE